MEIVLLTGNTDWWTSVRVECDTRVVCVVLSFSYDLPASFVREVFVAASSSISESRNWRVHAAAILSAFIQLDCLAWLATAYDHSQQIAEADDASALSRSFLALGSLYIPEGPGIHLALLETSSSLK